MDATTPATSRSKSQQAYHWVKERIASQEFTPGYRLVLGTIAGELDMSVVPVREAIRALGTDTVVDVVAREGELGLLHTFQQQPAQRDRSLHEQLHRFCSTKSGRKVRLAGALAAELALDAVPAPLLGVLTFAHAATA